MQVCSVCTAQTPKYRCPACKIRYCSLVCYQKHKETCLPAPSLTAPECKSSVSTDQWTVDDLLYEDDIIDKVPMDRLQLLGQSKELQELLLNPHLRQLLRCTDKAEDKAHAMKAAMQEPLFVEFSDCCLKIVDKDYLLNDE